MPVTTRAHPGALNLEAGTDALCACGATGNSPFWDGGHAKLKAAKSARPRWKFWG